MTSVATSTARLATVATLSRKTNKQSLIAEQHKHDLALNSMGPYSSRSILEQENWRENIIQAVQQISGDETSQT